MRNVIYIIVAGVGLAALVTATPAQETAMTARDLFYVPSTPPVKRPPPKGPKQLAKPTGAQNPQQGGAKESPSQADLGANSTVSVAGTLGLRYAILKQSANQIFEEVSPDTIFHKGDAIRLSVMANENGYLYIVQQGSSGTWSPLFPHQEINDGKNLIAAREKYEIPSGELGWVVDERAGEEKIFILLTRTPEPDLDKLVMTLQRGGNPRSGEISGAPVPVQNVEINNGLIAKVRQQVQSRDLALSKVDGREKAVYVVNSASSGPDSRVVVDVKLNHR